MEVHIVKSRWKVNTDVIVDPVEFFELSVLFST